MIDLTGKTILVTGASRGIGAVTAKTLAKAGASVILHYGHSRQQAEQIAAEMGECHLVQADLAQPSAAQQLWQQALAWRGQVDVLVNNAAIAPYAAVEDALEHWQQTWQQTTQVNLLTLADLCREAILHFRSRGGSIINIASRAAFRGDNPAAISRSVGVRPSSRASFHTA